MWTPKFDKNGARVDVGIGFFVSKLDGRRRVGHGGAVYGCATELMILPDDRLAVAVATSKDCANGVATRIAETILRTELAQRAGEPVPELSVSQPVGAALARAAAGSFGGETGVELVASGSRLFVFPRAGGVRSELRRDGGGASFVVDDEQAFGARYRIEGDRLLIGDCPPLVRSVDPPPPALPEAWRPLLGEYGWDHNVLNILEKDGKLKALIEWFFLYPLTDAGDGRFRFPSFGLYSDEDVSFERNEAGKVTAVIAAGVRFPRRPIDGEDGRTFRITPLRPIDELRAEASKAMPPEERGEFLASDLVDLTTLDSTIHLDIRYATDNNFLGVPVYSSARAFLQRPAAEALLRAHWSLARQGYGLLIHDGYRPWSVTSIFYDATPKASRGFVADPSTGSRHNRGCAVDLSLYDLKTGRPVEMVGGYDEFSPRAYPDYLGGTTAQRRLRSLLRTAMEAEGFVVIPNEWWHFDYRDWRRYRIGNEPFEAIKGKAGAQP
jgi:D-alanyl-D-alanine dipeptidase